MDTPPIQFVRTRDGFSIAYTVTGSGRDFIFHLSNGHTKLLWEHGTAMRRFLEQLSARFRLVSYDPRGQGMSMRGLADSLSYDDFELDLEAVINRVAGKRFVLVGCAGYAPAAIQYAVKHPERVVGLILMNCRVRGPYFGAGRGVPPDGDWDAYVETLARATFDFEDATFAKRLISEGRTQSDRVRFVELASRTDIADLARRIAVPTLLLAIRSQTWSLGLEEANRELAGLIPGAHLVLFDDMSVGMYAPEGETAPAVQAIDDFLAGFPRTAVSEKNLSDLSPREIEVLRLVAAGKTNRLIADELIISPNTVAHHMRNIFEKTLSANRAEATSFAHRHGLV